MYALDIKQLSKTYSNKNIEVEAVKNVDIKVPKGDFFALLGANGAGKSTIIGLITTLITKTAGQIKILGYNIETQPSQAKLLLGVVPQELNLSIFETCEQILINQAGYYGINRNDATKRANTLLHLLNLWEKRHTVVRQLSGGMKRRLMIARALMHSPRVLILDEPTAGVDVEIRRGMWDFLLELNAQGTTIILTTHYLEEAEQLCKNIAILDQGSIIENTSMKNLLLSLKHQTFIFQTTKSINTIPIIEPFKITMHDKRTFEIRVDNQWTLNDVFKRLDENKIHIHSMRNKTNRLEELFMDLIHNGK